MDWKSTAVISGAGILATWFFSMPPTQAPAGAIARPAREARTVAARIDIEREAAAAAQKPVPSTHGKTPCDRSARRGRGPSP